MTTIELEQTWTAVEDTVRGYLHNRLAGDASTVDDLAQEVFLRLRTGIGGLRSAGSLGPWIMRVARGVLVDHLRRCRPSSPVEDLVAAEGASDDRDAAAVLAGFVREQLDVLPAHEAQALTLVDLEGLAPAQVATGLSIGLPALKARLRRGRQRLRQAIERCCTVTLDGRGQPAECTPRGAGCGACTTNPA